MYCSQKCLDEDNQKFHKFECEFEFMPTTTDALLFEGFRAIFQILHHFDQNVKTMRNFLEENRGVKTAFDLDLSSVEDSEYKKNLLLACVNFTNLSDRKNAQLDNRIQFAIELLILKYRGIARVFSPYHNKKFLEKLLAKFKSPPHRSFCHNNIVMNMKESSNTVMESIKKDKNKSEPAGNFIFSSFDPFCDLLRFSCAPCIVLLNLNGKTAWIVVRPIKAGEAIKTSSNKPYAIRAPRAERQLNVKKLTNRDCHCEACDENWPELEKMPVMSKDQIEDETNILIENWKKLEEDDHLNRYKAAIPLLEYFGKSLPNMNYFAVYKRFMQDLFVLSQPKLFNEL